MAHCAGIDGLVHREYEVDPVLVRTLYPLRFFLHRADPTHCNSFFFFGGLGIHLSTALLAHLFSYNMTWQATKKEVERSNFFIEGPRILRRFWLSFVLSFAMVIGMIVLATPLVPPGWQIPGTNWAVIFPLACAIFFFTSVRAIL